MKLDLTSFDEKALKRDSKEPYTLLWRLREIIAEKKSLDSENLEHQAKFVEIDEEFMAVLQKLVKTTLWTVVKVSLSHIKDLFNAVSEKLEKTQENLKLDQKILLLQSLAILTQNNTAQEKADNVTCLIDILHKEDDLRIISATLEILYQISIKRQYELSERACYLSIAPNLLRSKENHYTLLDLSVGQNSKGEKLINSDLVFEIESQTQGLNDRSQAKTIVIPRDQLLNSEQTAAQLSTKLAAEHGKESSESFIYKLETKIQWLRFVNSEENLKEAIKAQLNTINVAYAWKNDTRHTEYIKYLKESFLQECIELMTQSGNKELVIKMIQTLNKLTQKDQGSYLSFDLLTKVQNQRQSEEESQRPLLVRVIEDISSIKVQEDGISLVKEAKTSTINQTIIKSSQFQYQFISFAFFVIRIIQAQHNRGSTLYQDTVNLMLGSLLKIVEDIPQFEAYAFHPKVTFLVTSILKLTVRPRIEEQNDIIKKFESRILFELQNIQKNINMCYDEEDICEEIEHKDRQIVVKNLLTMLTELITRDQQNLGMGRKILETKLLENLIKVLELNNEQTGHCVDEFLSKYITLVGSICSDNPASTPTLIKNGVFPAILQSLSQRVPQSSDMFESLIFSINQMSLHEEGQVLVLASNIFKTILSKVTDEKASQNFYSDQLLLRMYLCNLFDRNQAFKDTVKTSVFDYLDHIKDFVIQQNIKVIDILRKQDLDTTDKAKQLSQIDSAALYPTITAAIVMIHNMCFLSNDQMAQSRHTQDIISQDVFKKILEVYLILGSNPYLSEIFQQFLKIMKALVEYVNFAQNVQTYLDLFAQELDKFYALLGVPLYQIQEFNFDQKEELQELQPLAQLDLANLEQYLTRGEQLYLSLSRVCGFIKTTQYLHTATQHQMLQNPVIHKFGKVTYYLLRILQQQKVKYFGKVIAEMKQKQDGEDFQKYGNYLFTLYNSKELTHEEKRECIIQIRTFYQQVMEKRYYSSLIFPLKEKFLEDFINKISAFSFQMRHHHQKDALDKNLFFIGKIVYKTTKAFSKSKLEAIKVEPINDEFQEKLYHLYLLLGQIQNQIAHGWVDGASFFQFFKKGGLNNIIECFQWLGDNLPKINQEYQQNIVFLYDECCLTMKMIMSSMILSRNQENNINSLLNTNMGSDFESAKNLYQTFYHILCSKLLPLTSTESVQNPILHYHNQRCPYLQEVIMQLLQCASKSFSTCQLLKDGLRGDRDDGAGGRHGRGGRGGAGGGRHQANPIHVETLVNMGMGFTREKIQQALIQTQNNIDNAMNLLMEWQAQDQLGLEDALDRNIEDGLSSGDSDKEDTSARLFQLDAGKFIPEKIKKVEKVDEATFNETVKKTQQEGFKWMIEAQKTEELSQGKFRDFLIQIMLNEKQEVIQKSMFGQIDDLFNRNITNLTEKLTNFFIQKPKQQLQSEDQEMIDTTTTDNESSQIISQIQVLQNDIQIIQRVINNNKPYLKEAVTKCDVAMKSFSLLQILAQKFSEQSQQNQAIIDDGFSIQYQRLMLDIMVLQFAILQLSSLQINIYAASKIQVDQCQKKIKNFKTKIPTADLLKLCFNILSTFEDQQENLQQQKLLTFKTSIVSTAACIALRIVMVKDQDPQEKQDNVAKLFEMVTKFKNTKILDQKLLSSISLMHFETNKAIFNQMDKLTQRVLWLKSEYEGKIEDKKSSQKDQDLDQGNQLTKFNLNQFLSFFQTLQVRDQESFKQVLKENCEIKTIKKANVLSQDQALIRLKETKYNDLKKQVAKERTTLKQVVKSIDFHKESVKNQSKISKKALLSQLSEQQKQAILALIQKTADKTTSYLEEYNGFLTSQGKQQKFTKDKSTLIKFLAQDHIQFFETLFKMSQAYPATTAAILQSQPQQTKRSFINWFIKDFMVSQIIIRTVKEIKPSPQNQEQPAVDFQQNQQEIIFTLKSNLKQLDSFAFKALNNLTSYNHLMTLNEQCVKHEIRTKFVLEALSILSKTLKDKTSPQPLSKCLILSCLTVLDSLCNFQNTYLCKQQLILQDNFMNSIRAAILRDSPASKDSTQLPPSLIKLTDELLTEIVDVTLPSNSDIINKSVSILYDLAEFINNEKRKEEKLKLHQEQLIKKAEADKLHAQQKQQREGADVNMSEVAQEGGLIEPPPLAVIENPVLNDQQIMAGADSDDSMHHHLQEDMNQDDDEDDEGDEDEDLIGGGGDNDDDDEEDDENDNDEEDENQGEDDDDEDDDALINDDLDDEIGLHRQEGEHDLFEEEEEDDGFDSQEEEEIMIHERNEGADRRGGVAAPRLNDIINQVDIVRDANNIRYHGYRGGRNEVQVDRRNLQPDWSEEEAEVQRILVSMRAIHNVAVDRVGRHAIAPPVYAGYNRPLGGAHYQDGDPNKKSTLIDQLFEGLQHISEKELLDSVNAQKVLFEQDVREEARLKVASQQSIAGDKHPSAEFLGVIDQLYNARGAINALHRRIDNIGGAGEEIIIEHDINMADANFLVRGERNPQGVDWNTWMNQAFFNSIANPNPLADPMFARPNPFLSDFPPLGHNLYIPGGGGMHQFQDNLGMQNPAATADAQQLFNYFLRSNQTLNANTNEGLGQQLLENMEIEVEEIKEEVKAPTEEIATSKRRASIGGSGASNQSPDMMSNEQLLATFFNKDAEVEQELQRIEERSRELRNEVERQQQDIQQIVDSQQRQQEEMIQPSQIIQSSDAQMQIEQQQPLEQIQSSSQIQEQSQPEQIQEQQNADHPMQIENLIPIQQQQQEVPPEISNFSIRIVEENSQQQPSQTQEEVQEQSAFAEEEVKEQPSSTSTSNKTFGYDNELLLANGIDPAILLELPEELRAELLSTIDLPGIQEDQQQQQQPSSFPTFEIANQEEQKHGEQLPSQQQQPQPSANDAGNSLANDLGIDPEFLANLPEDMQLELLQNEQFRQRNLGQQQQPPQREAEQMDLASFIATVTDPALRREIFANMDEATIASLPPNLMAEARRFHDQIRYERVRARDQFANINQRASQLIEQIDPRFARGAGGFGGRDDPFGAIFGGRARPGGQREENKQQNQVSKTLDEIVATRQNQLTDELQNDDTIQSLTQQLTNDEKILEQLILILITNVSIECELIPCLQSLIKIHSTGLPVIRNKIINAITFLLKALSTGDDESVSQMFPTAQINKKQSLLILIGCLRLLLKGNKNLMKYILKGLIHKEDNLQHQKQSQILKKQFKAIKAKLSATEVSSFDENQAKQQKVLILPPLAEIFYLIRTDMFKNDKSLLRNLSLLIHQILKQFEIALEELESSNQAISSETVQSIAEVLSLDTIDQNLMQALGDFLFQISKKKKENFELISKYCKERSQQLLDKLIDKLKQISQTFLDIKSRVSPGKIHVLENYSPSQGGDSVYEEEKNEMIIDTSSNPLQELQRKDIKGALIKLPEEEEKQLKQQIKVQENSEILLRIFKLFNLFYEKFNEEKVKQQDNKDQTPSEMVILEIQELYKTPEISFFISKVSELLRIIFKTNLDVNEGVSNLIFCVFSSFYPELIQSIEHQKAQEELANAPGTSAENQTKYQIKMLPLVESNKRQERFVLFRNASFFTNRVEEFSNFILINKRIINKLIKTKTNLFANELEGLVRHMPNLLDFDNKRIYFKRELSKLKRNQQYDHQIQLFIRRDNIFMDSYAQLGIRQPNEMKGRLHIQFTGERGQDAGGLTRDFFIELSREMFNPNYSLFILSSSGSTYYPNPKSYVEADHLRYFKFIGRVIGKALFDECLLECYFVKSLYKIMTGEPLTFQDLEDFDNEFYNNLKWCIENDVTPLYHTFVTDLDYFGRSEEIELIEGGKKIPVTNENKNEYVEKLTHFKLYKCIQKQIDAFLEGFYELIPKDLVTLFNYKELELLISGLPNFDINDLKQNTEYMGYNTNSSQVLWLWEILESFENSERAEFLQFVTGSSKVPLDGFKGLMGMRGPQKFTVAKIKTDDILRLPSGHTWYNNYYLLTIITSFNQIDIPEYPSKEIMHERLLTAIKETKGFGFA